MVTFIEQNRTSILRQWDEVAATMQPAAAGMTHDEIRNHADELLEAIVQDIRSNLGGKAGPKKSRGDPPENSPALSSEAKRHAHNRFHHGFELGQLISEYRALRNSVVRSWSNFIDEMGDDQLQQLARFHEVVDEALSESATAYTDRLADARDILQGVLAHDLRDSLAAMAITADMLREESQDDGPRKKHAERIHKGTRRMQRLIEDLLEFTKMRLGEGMAMDFAPMNFGEVSSSIIGEIGVLAMPRTINLEKDGDLAGIGDAARLEQMVGNLVINAVRHSNDDGDVNVTVSADGDEIVVAVHNGGEAVAKGLQKTIFEPVGFVAESQPPKQDDRHVGLGLHIARHVAEAHGGSISLDSSDENGTTFTVRLPRRAKGRIALPDA